MGGFDDEEPPGPEQQGSEDQSEPGQGYVGDELRSRKGAEDEAEGDDADHGKADVAVLVVDEGCEDADGGNEHREAGSLSLRLGETEEVDESRDEKDAAADAEESAERPDEAAEQTEEEIGHEGSEDGEEVEVSDGGSSMTVGVAATAMSRETWACLVRSSSQRVPSQRGTPTE